jgi:hypothetical protein
LMLVARQAYVSRDPAQAIKKTLREDCYNALIHLDKIIVTCLHNVHMLIHISSKNTPDSQKNTG